MGEDTAVITWDPPSFDGGVPVKGTSCFLSGAPPLLLSPSVPAPRLPDGEEEGGLVQVDQAQL